MRRAARGTPVRGSDPLIIGDHFDIEYRHSYAQDSPFFTGIAQGKLLGTECKRCDFRFATPRLHCNRCGRRTRWIELPLDGNVHTFTTCYQAGELFRDETPFSLILVEFKGADTFFLSRLVGPDPAAIKIGMAVTARFVTPPKFRITDVYFVPKHRSRSGNGIPPASSDKK
jgi:uncharacterized OB-fold protein